VKPRLAITLALGVLLGGPCAGARRALGQTAPTRDDDLHGALQRLERVLQGGDPAAYQDLLSDSADRASAAGFAHAQILPATTRAVLQERERSPLAGSLPGNGYQLSLDAFVEFGDHARSASWSLDFRRAGPGDPWRISGQRKISEVENLYRLSIDAGREYQARGLAISVEDFDLTLAEGSAFGIEIDQGTTGLVLLGRGEMRFHPTPEVEQGQLKIFCGADVLRTRFDAAFIRFHPSDLARLVQPGQLTPRSVDLRDLRRAEEIFREEVPKSYAVDMSDLSRDLWSLVPASGDFLAEVRTERFDTLTYTKAGAEAEDLSLFDRKRHKNISVYASRDALARRGRSYSEDDFTAFDVVDYDIDLSMSPERLWLEGRATLRVRVTAPATTAVALRLAEPLVVHSVVSTRFGRLFSVRVKNQNIVFVNLPAAVLKDDEFPLTVTYGGRLEPQGAESENTGQIGNRREQPPPEELAVVRLEPSYLYSNRSYWYPQGPVADYATARIRITLPSEYSCVASGTPASPGPAPSPLDRSLRVYSFSASRPVRYLAFLVSRFLPSKPVAVQLGSGTPLDLDVRANPRHERQGRELAARARDIAQFYDSLVGGPPYSSFTIGLIEGNVPAGHSPGYFAAVSQPLPATPVTWRNDPASFDDYPEFFLAHELAHQWWGQAVGWRNYHEQWVSEGFAQYFAALYAQRARGDAVFQGMLRQFRRWGMQQSEQGPISLGYRLGHLRGDSRVFRALVYNKSAAVLHMLRRLVGDEAFFSGVRRFYEAAQFHKVGTDDFRVVMELETQRPLERFFDRWIYGSTLPRLKFSYRLDGSPGNQRVVLHVEQLGELFDLPLSVRLLYADRAEVVVIVPVTERVIDFPVPLAGRLRAVEVNRDDGTLAEIIKG
jgi:hypothetical protein